MTKPRDGRGQRSMAMVHWVIRSTNMVTIWTVAQICLKFPLHKSSSGCWDDMFACLLKNIITVYSHGVLLSLLGPMEVTIVLLTVKSGWFNVYTEGS